MEVIKEYNHFDCTLYMYTSIYMYTDWGKKEVCVSYCMFTPICTHLYIYIYMYTGVKGCLCPTVCLPLSLSLTKMATTYM